MYQAFLGGNTHDGSNILNHEASLVNLNRIVLLTPGRIANGLLAKAYLILINDHLSQLLSFF